MDIEARMREVEREIISRRPEHSVDLALDRMAELVGLLGDPQRACPVIHITGTNGKTSTARMTDALLRGRGLRTGRFTSPHLVSIRERIVVDGAPVSAERFVEAYEEIIPYVRLVDERHPAAMSFFEVLTGMAFAIFADTPVDVVVLEVGVGGRLDCTNVADGVVAVITPISIDHTRLLGDTVEEIAAEKAGIIKPGATAVLAQQPLAAAEVLLQALGRGGRDGGAGRRGVRRAEPRAGGGRPAAHPARPARHLRGHLPAAVRVVPGGQRGLRAGRGRGVRRRVGREHLRACRARPQPGPGGVREGHLAWPPRGHPAQSHHRHRRRAQPGRDGRDRGRPAGVVHLQPPHRCLRGQRGQGRGLHPRRTRAAARRDRGDPQLLRAVDGSRRDRRAGRRDLRRGRVRPRPGSTTRSRPRSRWPTRPTSRRGNRPGQRRGADHRIRHHRGRRPQAARPGRGGLPPEPAASQPSRHSFTAAELS